jgi:hypothetical protein
MDQIKTSFLNQDIKFIGEEILMHQQFKLLLVNFKFLFSFLGNTFDS